MKISIPTIEATIKALAERYALTLKNKINLREIEMAQDNVSHYLIYQVLGIRLEEGRLIDLYQNKGRFLYKYAGSFLEEATKLCFLEYFPTSGSCRIKNTLGLRPKTFEIDCLINNHIALEIKWRDATTDGDHITKEHTRIQAISQAGFCPVRIMFYYPNREQAIRIQKTLATLYLGLSGEYYCGEDAWNYVKKMTNIDLKDILERLALENTQ
jgi:hypothetical protein